jgi:hypothetical protein
MTSGNQTYIQQCNQQFNIFLTLISLFNSHLVELHDGYDFFPYKYNDFITLCKYGMSSNTFAANVDKMGTSVPKLWCRVLYTLTHLITATTRVQNAVKRR